VLGREPTLLKSATRGQCDARPTVTFPAARHRRSSTTQYPFILLGERVLRTTCLRLVPESGTDRSGTGDLRVASPLHRVAGVRGRIATVCRTGSARSITRSTGSIREVLSACAGSTMSSRIRASCTRPERGTQLVFCQRLVRLVVNSSNSSSRQGIYVATLASLSICSRARRF